MDERDCAPNRYWLLSQAMISPELFNIQGSMSQDHWEHAIATTIIKNFVRPIYTVLEIGVYSGYSMMGWLQVSDPTVVAVGLDMAPVVNAPWPKNVSMVTGDSHNPAIIKRVHSMFPKGVDFLFIDGDHSLQGCRDDYNYYCDLVNPNGLIGFHDILIGDVRATWREMVKRYPSVQIQNVAPDGSRMGIGLTFNLPQVHGFKPIELDEE